MKNFYDYDFAVTVMLQGEDSGHTGERTHDLDSVLFEFNSYLNDQNTPLPDLPGFSPVDSVDIIYTRAGDDISWTTLISWSRSHGFSFLPELPQDIMAEVLDSIMYHWMEKI